MDNIDPLPTRFELPRLHVIHLLAWTAAIVIAFLPYQLQLKALQRSDAAMPEQTSAMTGTSVAYILAEGTLLLVAGAVLVWIGRGYFGRLAPGHHLALQAAMDWALMLASSMLIYGGPNALHLIVRILHLLANIAFLVWFLGLALRRDETKPWRAAFAILAVAPALRAVLSLGNIGVFNLGVLSYGLIVNLFASGIQTAALVPALISDWLRGPRRHWSHWLGALARLLLFGTMEIANLWMWMNPPRV